MITSQTQPRTGSHQKTIVTFRREAAAARAVLSNLARRSWRRISGGAELGIADLLAQGPRSVENGRRDARSTVASIASCRARGCGGFAEKKRSASSSDAVGRTVRAELKVYALAPILWAGRALAGWGEAVYTRAGRCVGACAGTEVFRILRHAGEARVFDER